MSQNAQALAAHVSSLSRKIVEIVSSHNFSESATDELVAVFGEDRRDEVLELVGHMVAHERAKGAEKYAEHDAYGEIFSSLIGAPAEAMQNMQEILAGGGTINTIAGTYGWHVERVQDFLDGDIEAYWRRGRTRMSAEDFNEWLAAMKDVGLAKTDAQCAKLLGITANGLLKRKKQGAGIETALACAALLAGVEPYGS